MTNIVIKIPTIVLKVSPYGFYKYAEDFFNAGMKYKKNTKFSPVPYYLYCRSIELSLKSFLLFADKNINMQKLKHEYGHNIITLVNKTESLFSKKLLNKKEREVIKIANNWYYDKGFEYFRVQDFAHGFSGLPDLLKLEKISQKLLRKFKIVKEDYFSQ